jgi:hypothetical protein
MYRILSLRLYRILYLQFQFYHHYNSLLLFINILFDVSKPTVKVNF